MQRRDAACYNAAGRYCKCCCGGRNHGVGLDQAVENTQRMFPEIIEEIKAREPGARIVPRQYDLLELPVGG